MTPTSLSGRTALVTGGSGHLGGAVCRTLVAQGATVVATFCRRKDRAYRLRDEITAAGGTAEVVAADLTERPATDLLAEVRQLAGPPDVLVCAHGGSRRQGVLDGGAPATRELWEQNFETAISLAGAAAKGMLRRRFGRVVLFGSRAGLVGLPGQAGYAAAKAALSAWATSAAGELGPFGITVNVVAPGAVEPDPDPDVPALYTAEEDAAVAERTAVRRLATADEVAAAVAFLCAPSAGYVTGHTLPVDGGARW